MTVGVIATPLLLGVNIYNSLRNTGTQFDVVVNIPGVTFPLDRTIALLVCTFLSVTVHEIGHAIASIFEHVEVEAFGFYLTVFVPGAYVTIDDSVRKLAPFAQLSIYSAGVFFNILLGLVCIVVRVALSSSINIIFVKSNGAVVNYVSNQANSLSDHIKLGSVVYQINNVQVFSRDHLDDELRRSKYMLMNDQKVPLNGICATADLLIRRVASSNSCCGRPIVNASLSSERCFSVHNANDPLTGNISLSNICISPKIVYSDEIDAHLQNVSIDNSKHTKMERQRKFRVCKRKEDCSHNDTGFHISDIDNCVFDPKITPPLTRLYISESDDMLIYEGDPYDLLRYFRFGNHLPRLPLYPSSLGGYGLLLRLPENIQSNLNLCMEVTI